VVGDDGEKMAMLSRDAEAQAAGRDIVRVAANAQRIVGRSRI
jgi:hypothetical protein